MAEAVYLPKVGMTMEEGTLCRWLAADEASITAGEPLFEMETEKVQMEVEAEAEGVLKQLVEEGTKLKPGDIVGCLLAPGESVPAELLATVAAQLLSREVAPAADAEPAAQPPLRPPGDRLRISPVARRLAQELGVDPASVRGSGPDGRITEQDVRRHADAGAAAESVAAGPASDRDATIPYTGRRRTIGERMLQSLQTSAQLTLTTEADAGDAMRMLHGLNREWRREAVVTMTALVVRACGIALREHPRLNSRLEGDAVRVLPEVNVGIAVDLAEGLIVPVVRAADRASLKDVAKTVTDLSERARSGSLGVDDVTGGTFTVTSLESYGIDAFTPIVNPPQAAILGIGRVREVAAFDGPEVVRRQVLTLSLSFDHRIVDGAPAARFLARVAELIGRPYVLM